VSSAYVTTLTFNGSCPGGDVTSLMTSLAAELNRRAVCGTGTGGRLADVCDVGNYAVCPGVRQTGRTGRQTPPPLTVSIVLYVPDTCVPRHTHTRSSVTVRVAEKSTGINGLLPSEARRADSGGGVLGEGQLAPCPSVRRFGELCKLPQRDPGHSHGCSTISLYFEVSRQLILLRY